MSRRGLDRKTAVDLVRLIAFMVVTALATGLLIVTIGNISFGASERYQAIFTDVTGVNPGDDVRIAGVKVGSVKEVGLNPSGGAELTFTVADNQKVAATTRVHVRYRNIVGQRYVALIDTNEAGPELAPGATIAVSNTQPALDLTTLFNGFKPLFEALDPDQVNSLAFEIIQVFQGEGGTLDALLARTGSVTQTLAERDQVIDSLIANLNDVLAHLGGRDRELADLIVTFKGFVSGLEEEKEVIVGSLDEIAEVSVATSELLSGIRAPLTADVKHLRSLTNNLVDERAEIDRALQVLPIKLNKIGNTASYGSWFNFFLCDFEGVIKLPGGNQIKLGTPTLGLNIGKRCNLG